MAEKYENEEHRLKIKQTMKDLFKPFQEMLDKKRWDTANNPKLIGFSKKCNIFGKLCQNRHGKTKKKSGIRSFDLGKFCQNRHGHQKQTGN